MPGEPIPFSGDFSYGYYLRLLGRCAERFRLLPLRDFAESTGSGERRMYVRHDIDLCLDAAARLAEVEAESGFATTYMFIPTSPLYAIESAYGRARLRRIAELGHEVSIHFDVATSGVTDPTDVALLHSRIDAQCARIEDIVGQAVESVSFHRPLPVFLNGPDLLHGRVNAYASTLMDCYRSDSAGRWRMSDPMIDLPGSDAPVAQLLTHPIWWNETHQAPSATLDAFIEARIAGLDPDSSERFERLVTETVPGVARERRSAPIQ